MLHFYFSAEIFVVVAEEDVSTSLGKKAHRAGARLHRLGVARAVDSTGDEG